MLKRSEIRPLGGATFWDNHKTANFRKKNLKTLRFVGLRAPLLRFRQFEIFYFFFHRRRSAPELKKVADNTTDSEDEAGIDDLDDDVYLPPTSTNKDLSPTQSVRSLILRPRSTPIRRATISAGSPSKHQPYMNVSEIWTSSLYDTARSTKSNNSDGASKHSSASSTMHSNDSGCATMYSSGDHFLPVTKSPSSQYINMHQDDNPKEDYINLFACSTLASGSAAAGKRHPPPPPLLPPKREFHI